MSIYTHLAIDRTPYTYLIGWSTHNIFYYGRRTAINCHPNEFWKTYFTSSNHVKEFRKLNGEPDIIEIRKTFNNIKLCRKWEEKVLSRLNVRNNSKWLNKTNGDLDFDSTGYSLYYDSNRNKIKLKINHEDVISGKVSPVLKNIVMVRDLDGNTFRTSINNPKYLSGEYVPANKGIKKRFRIGFFTAKDKSGKTYSVNKEDSRILSGELVHICTGVSNKGSLNTLVVYDKILNKKFRVPIDDKRVKSGEFQSYNKGKFIAKDLDGNKFSIFCDDPRYLSGELVGMTKGTSPQLGMVHPKLTCPICGKVGGARNMKRYHFNNCKY